MLTREEMIGLITGKLIRVCNRCKCEVVYDDWGELVSPNYDCACLVCDEDLFHFETKLVPKEEVRLFIGNEDKAHYLKHGSLTIKTLLENGLITKGEAKFYIKSDFNEN